MRAPLSWLRDFAPFGDDIDLLVTRLNELGLVVDGVSRVGEGLDGVVVARVEEIRPIEGADRIRSVVVDVGGEPVDVVCGAWNFEVGDLVPLATVGTVLPGADFAIARRKMKGAVSNGMLCSGVELGLSEDAAGIMILPAGLQTGVPFAEAMGIGPDVVFDLDITPNRPDALSMAGVARDLAAGLRLPFAVPDLPLAAGDLPSLGAPIGDDPGFRVGTEDQGLCPLFSARAVADLRVGSSPSWMAQRLTLAGMRPINSVVDASNYVMLELGQPTHPYDRARVPGQALVARPARAGEVVVTLDGVERRLGEQDCVIVDGQDRPLGIGGVMGGEAAEITPDTTEVVVEAAYFTPMAIAHTAKRLGLRTEASARFERGCDPEITEAAAERVCRLAASVGARWQGPALLAGARPERLRLQLRSDRVNALLGTELAPADMADHLRRIGFGVETGRDAAGPDDGGLRRPAGVAGAVMDVEVPGWRPDVSQEIDLVEEVARHHGYANVARTVPTTAQVGQLSPYQLHRRRVRQVMVGAGLTEVWTPSLLNPVDHGRVRVIGAEGETGDPALELANPMSREESVLRRTMLPGLLRVGRFNLARRNPPPRIFEVGTVFAPGPDGGLPVETERVTVALIGRDASAAVELWRTLEAALRLARVELEPAVLNGLHPTRSARLSSAGTEVGSVGEVAPEVVEDFGLEGRVAWLDLDLSALASAPRRTSLVRPVSAYPSSDVDLAFVIDEATAAGAVEATLRSAAGDLLEDLWLFDVFRDPANLGSERSLAWRLRFCALDHTLTDAEVAEVRQRCVAAVEAAHPARLRA